MACLGSIAKYFAVLLYFGREIYHQAPPIPEFVQTPAGDVLYTRADIERGQNIWQSTGGMQQGSVWGHGAYLAPDWSADWLHREAEALLALITKGDAKVADISSEQLMELRKVILRTEMRENTYNSSTGIVTISLERAQAVRTVADHYKGLFQASNESFLQLRRDYAFPLHSALDAQDAHALSAFFFLDRVECGNQSYRR